MSHAIANNKTVKETVTFHLHTRVKNHLPVAWMQKCKYDTVSLCVVSILKGDSFFFLQRGFFWFVLKTERQDHEILIGIKAMTDK